MVDTGRARRLHATVFVLAGEAPLTSYLHELHEHRDDFAAWDGRVVAIDRDGTPEHQVIVVDRYGQIYETKVATDARALPRSHELEEWFRFLATACPECGVLDDPRQRGWVP